MAPDASHALAARQKVQQFLTAACTGNLDLLKKIAAQLDDGKGLEKTIADIKDANQRGAIHFAAREGKTEVCKYLVEDLKIDVDTKDEDGETALIHATRQGHIDTVKYLVEHGANPTIATELGTTALHHAAGTGNVELLRYLLSKGADVNSQGDIGTPLIWAAGHAQNDTLKVLLEHHANPNLETEDGITPVLSAVAAGSLACIESLVQVGANVNVHAGGATPLHIAADNGNPDILNCLLKAGADPNALDDDEQKPVQVAAARGNRAAVELLLPSTTKIDTIPEWTVDGIIEYVQSENKNQEEMTKNTKIVRGDGTKVPKTDIPEVSTEAKQKAAEAKARGDEAFKRQEYSKAVDAYTEAIEQDPSDAVLPSNRSLCWLRLDKFDDALADAKKSRDLNPTWPKACYREGSALYAMQRYEDAANAFYEGVKLDPENTEMVAQFRRSVEAGRKLYAESQQKSGGI